MVGLKDIEVIQVDATMIVGVLIFLTISSVAGPESPVLEVTNRLIGTIITGMIVIPFSFSALLVTSANATLLHWLQGKLTRYKLRLKFRTRAIYVTIFGFIYVIAAIFILAFAILLPLPVQTFA
jgi:hypothetical protein